MALSIRLRHPPRPAQRTLAPADHAELRRAPSAAELGFGRWADPFQDAFEAPLKRPSQFAARTHVRLSLPLACGPEAAPQTDSSGTAVRPCLHGWESYGCR